MSVKTFHTEMIVKMKDKKKKIEPFLRLAKSSSNLSALSNCRSLRRSCMYSYSHSSGVMERNMSSLLLELIRTFFILCISNLFINPAVKFPSRRKNSLYFEKNTFHLQYFAILSFIPMVKVLHFSNYRNKMN